MSLFDVIKFPNIDISDIDGLDRLPKEVINEWHKRLIEFCCRIAELITDTDQDESGKLQEFVDAVRAYMRGDISKNELRLAKSAASSAHGAAHFVIKYTFDGIMDDHNNATYHTCSAVSNVMYRMYGETYEDEMMVIYKDWLIEELLAYESV
jgi:hypothetical protein